MTTIARRVLIASVALALLSAGGIGAYRLYRQATDITVVGDYTLGAGQFAETDAKSFSCHGIGEYADIRSGAQVVVTDDSGDIVGTGQLSGGFGSAEWVTPECRFEFRITGVPGGSGSYGLEVSHRGKVRYTRAEVEKWHFLGRSG